MIPIYSIADLGAQVRRSRKAQGLTQTELADACGVSLSFVSNLEKGKETTEAGKMLRVINTLGIDVLLKPRGE